MLGAALANSSLGEMNCQAVCDVCGRILDNSIVYPESTLDRLAFEGMSIFHKLEEGILAPGLCIFGDNAYLNTPDMTMPYAAVLGGTKDACNFYHLQLRICIECTFGMLTHRWTTLRSAIPMNVRVQKAVAIVLALTKLYNYCVDNDGTSDLTFPARDEWQLEINGAVPLVATGDKQKSSGHCRRGIKILRFFLVFSMLPSSMSTATVAAATASGDSWCPRHIGCACATGETLSRILEKLVRVSNFPEIQQVGWSSVKESLSILRRTTWSCIKRPNIGVRKFVVK